MKLDTKNLRHLTENDWRVLKTVERESRNYEVVPTKEIEKHSRLKGGGSAVSYISNLAKANLIARVKNASYDGYRLTYGGLDYLALNTHSERHTVYSVGNQIGIGKESDIFVVADKKGRQHVLKIHRLGRISFRTVKTNRNYLKGQHNDSWMSMSQLSAQREYFFMTALRNNGFTVPEPLAQDRHTIVMELIDAFPLRQIVEIPDPANLYAELIEIILRLAGVGLVHCDFNEFNILIKEKKSTPQPDQESSGSATKEVVQLIPVLIDFPQMISVDHVNAEMYFDRDVSCIKKFFSRRFGFTSDEPGPFFSEAKKPSERKDTLRLDLQVEAKYSNKKKAKQLEAYMKEHRIYGDGISGEGIDTVRYDSDEDPSDGASDNEIEDQEVDCAAPEKDSVLQDRVKADTTNSIRTENFESTDHLQALSITNRT